MTEHERAVVKECIEKVAQAGREGVGYVGSANYQSREDEARQRVDRAEQEALMIIKQVG